MVHVVLEKWFLEYNLLQVYFYLTQVLSGAEETKYLCFFLFWGKKKTTSLSHRTWGKFTCTCELLECLGAVQTFGQKREWQVGVGTLLPLASTEHERLRRWWQQLKKALSPSEVHCDSWTRSASVSLPFWDTFPSPNGMPLQGWAGTAHAALARGLGAELARGAGRELLSSLPCLSTYHLEQVPRALVHGLIPVVLLTLLNAIT